MILIGVAVITACAVNIKPTKAADDSNFVVVDEIYGDCANVQKLYNLIGGAEHTDLAKITELANAKTNAAEMRAKTYNKTNGQDIQVTFGGKIWDVVYLSTTNDNRPILTLWLHEPFTTSQWNKWSLNDASVTYPCNMYGTSYIRALINNGGQYAADGGMSLTDYTPVTDYALREFLPNGKYGDLIVTPEFVDWQKEGQERKVIAEQDWLSSANENWGDVDYDFQTLNGVSLNYSGREGNDVWKDDNLWLGSLSETYQYVKSIFRLSTNQRVVGSIYWSRSGDYEDTLRQLSAYSYVLNDEPNNNYINVTSTSGVRPALHLDLQALNAARTTEHNYGDWQITAATCTMDGEKHRTCQDCGYIESEVLPAIGHNYTPSFDGRYTTYTCSICRYVNESMKHECNDKQGHNFIDTLVAPKCEEKGHTEHFCDKCGYGYIDNYTPATGHSYGPWVTVEPATTDAAGVQKRNCEHCGAEQTRSIAPLAGTTNNGKDNSAPLLWGIIIGIIAVLAGCGGLAWLLLAVFKPRKTKHTDTPKTPTPSKTKPDKQPNVATA